ncbi:MoaF C-terminal domain-containing protein [Amycolatopsis sp. NPDC047767]|uniref:MoaF C-terminal domain-containing protein n=1 Tax=Amycolatopsis sp. NPDC047767 TaxID=3156765 RepID=UPI0034571090
MTRHSTVAGREIVFTNSYGSRVVHRFGATILDWSYEPGPGDPHPALSGRDDYEAFEIADGLVYTQFHHQVDVPDVAVSLVLDFEHGRSLAVVSTIEDRARVRHTFLPGLIEGLATSGTEPAPTAALLGRRVRWTYGDGSRYEHVHVEPNANSWRCVSGPSAGLTGTDECTTYELRPEIYVLAAREKAAPSASVTIADHRDLAALRAYGAVFGLDRTGAQPTQHTFGAAGELLGHTATTV